MVIQQSKQNFAGAKIYHLGIVPSKNVARVTIDKGSTPFPHSFEADQLVVCDLGSAEGGECDGRTDSPSFRQVMDFLTGDYQPARALKIPPGIAHGCKTVQGPINFIDVRSRVYDLADEIHIANDDPEIAFDWLRRPEIS